MNDQDLLDRIAALVSEEHDLERKHASLSDGAEIAPRLSQIEIALDQCWDLLRRRRARKEFGQDVEETVARPASQVEGYLQ